MIQLVSAVGQLRHESRKPLQHKSAELVVLQCTGIQWFLVSFRLLHLKAATGGATALFCLWSNSEAANYGCILQSTPHSMPVCSLYRILCICSFIPLRLYVLSLPFTRMFSFISLVLFFHVTALCFQSVFSLPEPRPVRRY